MNPGTYTIEAVDLGRLAGGGHRFVTAAGHYFIASRDGGLLGFAADAVDSEDSRGAYLRVTLETGSTMRTHVTATELISLRQLGALAPAATVDADAPITDDEIRVFWQRFTERFGGGR